MASGARNNREIPVEEPGIQRGTGRVSKAGDFDQGEAGGDPEDISARHAQEQGGNDNVRSNIKNAQPYHDAATLGRPIENRGPSIPPHIITDPISLFWPTQAEDCTYNRKAVINPGWVCLTYHFPTPLLIIQNLCSSSRILTDSEQTGRTDWPLVSRPA